MSNSRTDWWPPLEGESSGQPHPSAPQQPAGLPHPGEDLFGAVPSDEPTSRRSRSGARAHRAKERKHRRRRSFLVLTLVVAMLGGAAFVVYSLVGSTWHLGSTGAVSDYPGPGYPSAQVVVNPGDSGAQIGKTLVDAGVVASQKAFTAAFSANPDASKIQPGTYNLLLKMKASDAVAALLNPASRVSMRLTIPEGQTAAQILAKVTEVALIPAKDLQAAAADPAAIGLPAQANGKIEGWLYPATYQVQPGETATAVLKQMVAQTVSVLTAKNVPQDQWEAVLTKASLIEREGKLDADRPKMARVIENRLAKGMPLQMDTAVAYGAQKSAMTLTDADFKDANNPYNVYVHTGLPPTPIASPGEKSIDAALNPAPGDWLFWVTVNLDTGETKFATTFAEHQQYVDEYKAWMASHASTSATPAG